MSVQLQQTRQTLPSQRSIFAVVASRALATIVNINLKAALCLNIILFVFLASTSIGQTGADTVSCLHVSDTLTNCNVYLFVDKGPTAEGGDEKLFEALRNIKIEPGYATNRSTILTAFIVNADGSISGERIINDIEGTDYANQILEIVNSIKWIPGECNGQKVPVLFKLPVRIELNEY